MTDAAPVLDAIREFQARGDVVYAPPGHKHGRGVAPEVLELLGPGMFAADVLSLNGFDDRTESRDILKAAEKLMADAVHADHAFFATCGSSMSVKTAMISVAGPGEKLLLARNAHKSVVAGLVISGIDPVWVPVRFDDRWQLTHPPGPEELAPLLDAHPDAKGALLITPTDWGSCADLRGAASVCHAHGVPLIVDEAWGAHLPFLDAFPTWGMDAGADVVVTSVHKMGSAVGWRRQMVRDGKRLWALALARAERIRAEIRAIGSCELMDGEVVGPRGAAELDPMRLTLDVRPLGISGYQAADWLREHRRVNVGVADSVHVGHLRAGADAGMHIPDAADPTMATVRVVARGKDRS